MLDIILIQHNDTGLNLLEYRQENTKMKLEHTDIFSGFMTAIQNISEELDIGTVVLISTKGSKGHNCIIIKNFPINVILLADQDDPIDHWKRTGEEIAQKFIEMYGLSFDPTIVTQFNKFTEVIKKICVNNEYCD
jgi:hypothetical protein